MNHILFIIWPFTKNQSYHSMNIIGKAGGLQGERTDILVATKIFYDKTHDLSGIKYGNIDIEDLKKVTKSKRIKILNIKVLTMKPA